MNIIDDSTESMVELNQPYTQQRCSIRTIMNDLVTIDITDDVKKEADDVFQKLGTPTHRGKKRKQLIFFCIYQAYKNLHSVKDPNSILKLIGLERPDIAKAVSLFTSQYLPDDIQRVTPIYFISQYFELCGLSLKLKTEIISMASNILDKSPHLYELLPQYVAISFLLYYMMINGITYDLNQFCSKIDKSPITVTKLCNEIGRIYNST